MEETAASETTTAHQGRLLTFCKIQCYHCLNVYVLNQIVTTQSEIPLLESVPECNYLL